MSGDWKYPLPTDYNEHYVDWAERDLETIKGSLQCLLELIDDIRPDYLIFLDRKARIFREPFQRFLKKKIGKEMPIVGSYNDEDLKWKYLQTNLDIEFLEEEFNIIKGKKVIVVDETYSFGKGAAAIQQAIEMLEHEDIYYFALVRDEDPLEEEYGLLGNISIEEHKKNIEKVLRDPKFIICNPAIGNSHLFTMYLMNNYLDEQRINGKTVTRADKGAFKKKGSGEKVYDEERYTIPYNEYQRLRKKQVYCTIGIIKKMILEKLESLHVCEEEV